MGARKIFACRVEEVLPGRQKIVKVDGMSVGIFNVDGAYHALLNRCPHRGGALCEGPVCGTTEPTDRYAFVYGRRNALVRCAWHGWEFDIRTGASLVDPKMKTRTFVVSVEGGEVFVHLEPALSPLARGLPREAGPEERHRPIEQVPGVRLRRTWHRTCFRTIAFHIDRVGGLAKTVIRSATTTPGGQRGGPK